jgi:tetratricopeptide (TPR) repeat protein
MNNRTFAVVFCLLICRPVMAQGSGQEVAQSNLQKIEQAFINTSEYHSLKKSINKQEFVQAWKIAQLNADEYLGDAEFDFLYGIAALANNEFELAVFAFERVVANKPNWLDGKYYLAKSYFKMANYRSVLSLCDAIISHPNNSEQLVLLSNKLKSSAQKKLAQQSLYFQQQVSVNAGYDSNINAGIDDDSIFLPSLGGIYTLSDNSKETSDNYLAINYQLSGSKALSQKTKLLFSTKVNIHNFVSEHDYNRIILDGSVDYLRQFDSFDASVGLRVQPLWFSGDYYRTQSGINTKLKKRLGQQWLIGGDFGVGKTNNSLNDNLDTNNLNLSANSQYFTGNWRHSLSASYIEERSQSSVNDHISSQLQALSFNSLWVIDSQWLVSGSLSWQHKKYQDLHPTFFTKQVDNTWMLATMVQFQQSQEISYRFNVSVQDKDSNLPLFSYQRVDIGLSASMNF